MSASKPDGSEPFSIRIQQLIKAKDLGQLLRYGMVGVGINSALYVCYLLLVFVNVEAKVAMTIVYIIGLIVGFFGHRRLTFFHNENAKLTMARYSVAHIGGYAINFLLLFVLVDKAGFSHAIVQAVSVFIVAVYLFVLFKYWVFSEKKYVAS